MDLTLKNLEVTRVWENTRGQYTDYCCNVKWQDGTYPNYLCLKAKTPDVFEGIKAGDILEEAYVFVNGRAWESPKDGEVVFVDFKVTRRENLKVKSANTAPLMECTWKEAQTVFIMAKGLEKADAATIKAKFGEFCKATIPGKTAKEYQPTDWAKIANTASGATAAEEPAPDFGSDPDDLPF